MIVSLHVATGAAVGALAGSRRRALLLGPVAHLAGDLVPHRDFPSRSFEAATGVAAVALLALRRGPLDPATLCGAAAAAPDLEHVLPLPWPGGRPLFPSHRFPALHRAGGISAPAQLAVAALLLALLAARGSPRRSG